VVVPQGDCGRAVRELRREFENDIARKVIDDIKQQDPVAIIAVVGEGMKGMRGIAGRTFSAVAQAGVNIVAIAQGSSELNISFVVEQAEAQKTVRAIHDSVISG
jgi:aspartokinase